VAGYLLHKGAVHSKWDFSLPPALEIEPGDIVHFEVGEGTYGQITPVSTTEILSSLDWDRVFELRGPIYVRGAEPADVLSVEILETKVGSWGWTAILPGLGLLAEEFPDPYLRIWDLSDGKTARLRPDICIPLDPFCGTMGVAPAEKGPLFPGPPGPVGGNMDPRHLHEGSTLLLPVQVEGGLFSAGDGHALQGDGEICGTAIEAPLEFSLRFDLRQDISIREPQFVCKGPLTPQVDTRGYYGTMGIGPDLKESARRAIRYMIEHLMGSYRLTREEAYILCSLAVDLKISEIVSANSVVSAYIPLSIFTS